MLGSWKNDWGHYAKLNNWRKERKWARGKERVKKSVIEGARKGRREGGEKMKKKIMKANSDNITLLEILN